MTPVVTVLLTIGSISSAMMALIAFISFVFKKPKQWIKKWIKDIAKEEIRDQVKQLDEIKEKIDSLMEREKTKIGHSIMTIYDRSIARGYITIGDKKDLIELHQIYKDAKGNHHVDEYFEIMMDMDVR